MWWNGSFILLFWEEEREFRLLRITLTMDKSSARWRKKRNVGGAFFFVTLLNADSRNCVCVATTRRRRRRWHTPSTHGAHAPSHTQFSRSRVGFLPYTRTLSHNAKRPLHTQVVDSFRLLQTSSSSSPPSHLFSCFPSRWVFFQSIVYSRILKQNRKDLFNYYSR